MMILLKNSKDVISAISATSATLYGPLLYFFRDNFLQDILKKAGMLKTRAGLSLY